MSARTPPPEIRAACEDDCPALAHLIQLAYKDVALRFGLTPENCPKHPSNCTDAWIRSDLERGVTYSILESGPILVGCAALDHRSRRCLSHAACRSAGIPPPGVW